MRYYFVVLILFEIFWSYSQGATCGLASNVIPGTYSASAINGNGASQSGATGSNWYKFTPTTNGNLSINSCGGGTDTRLWIWTGSCGNLLLIGANDDFSGCISSGTNSFASRVDNLILTAGSTYFFEWDNAWSNSGFTWNFSYTALPNNNDVGIIYLKNRFTKIPLNQANYGIPFGATIKNFSGNSITNVTLTTEIYELPNINTPIQVLTSPPVSLGVGAQQAIVSGTWFPNLSVSKNYLIKYIKSQTTIDGVTSNDVSTQNLCIDFNYFARDNNTFTNAFNWSTSSEYDQGVVYTITGNDVLSGVQFYAQSSSTTQEYYVEVFPIMNNIIQTTPIYTSPNCISTGAGWQTHTLVNPLNLTSGSYLFSIHKLGNSPFPIGCDASIFSNGKNYVRTNISGNWNTIESYSVNYAFMIRPKLGSNPMVDVSYVSHQSPGGEFTKIHTRQSVNGNNLTLSACGKNAGSATIYNVTLTVNIKNTATNVLVYSATSSTHNLISGQIDTFTVSNFSIQSLGNYSIEYVFNVINDQIPFNNSYITYFSRTKSELSRIVGTTGTIGIGNNLTSAYDNGVIGQTFTLGQQDFLDSVKIGLAAGTPSNQPIRVDIYATDVNGFPIGSPIISTSTYTSTASNSISGALIYLPINGGTFTLNPGTYFFGVIENAGNIKLQTSTDYFKSNRAFMKWNQNPNGSTAWTPIENFGYSVGLAIHPIFKVCLPIQANTLVSNATCGQNNGSIQIMTTGGTGLFTFNWSNNGVNTATNNNLSPGSYSCQLADANQCPAPTQFANISMLSSAVNSTVSSISHPFCHGALTGSISLQATGGNGQYTYTWTPSLGSTATLSNIGAGMYSCQIIDGLGCSSIQQITITEPSAISLNSMTTPISCYGGNDGTLLLTPNGGTSPYHFMWSANLGTSNSISNLTSGTYSCQVTDANNCILNQSFQLLNPPAITTTILNVSNVNCFGTSTGSASISASGGTGLLMSTWSPGAVSGSVISNVAAGTYTCTTSDANGCQFNTNVTITQPSMLSSMISSQIPVSCYGSSNGSAQVQGVGGSPPYSYAWSPVLGNSNLLTNLVAGTYQCFITDAHGCTTNQVVSIYSPTAITVGTSVISAATCGQNNGALALIVNGGSGTYTYDWTPNVGSTANLSNLFAGTYHVVVHDQNGCTGTLAVGINNLSGPTVSLVSQTPVSCFNGSNGSAQISAIGGTGSLSYYWTGNPTGNGTNLISNLSAGQYACQVIDANGCTGTIVVPITQATVITGTITTNIPANCYGTASGQLSVLATGGTPGYTYSWSPINGSSNQLLNVPAGNYTCHVTDQNGCVGTITGTVNQPNPLQIILDTLISPTCGYSNNGFISVHGTGGNGMYSYLWSPGNNNSASPANISIGNHTVNVTDNLGCTTAQTFIVQSQSNIQVQGITTQIDCEGNANGQIVLSPSNGVIPYHFLWSNMETVNSLNNLINGIYSCIVSDALGCQSSFSDTIFTQSNLTAQISGNSIVCDSSSMGMLMVTAANGVFPYSYAWMNSSESSNSLQTNGPGAFEAIVSDSLNCQDTVSFQINLSDLSATSQILPVTCPGGQNGSIEVIVQGGQAPYTYDWVDYPVNSPIISGLGAGAYVCSVQDQLGCSYLIQNVVIEPFPWNINVVISPELLGMDGSINLGVSGATPPYNYTWNNGQTSNNLLNLSGGIYSLMITDAQGCQVEDTFLVDSELILTEKDFKCVLLYPNPNHGQFHVVMEKGEIVALQDAIGRNIPYELYENTRHQTVRMTDVLPGIYYLKLDLENGQSETICFEVF